MRLSLESSRETLHTSSERSGPATSSHSSAFCPIDVDSEDAHDSINDDDDDDDAEPQFARGPHVTTTAMTAINSRPVLLNRSVDDANPSPEKPKKARETVDGTRRKEPPRHTQRSSERSHKYDTKGVCRPSVVDPSPDHQWHHNRFRMETDAVRTRQRGTDGTAVAYQRSNGRLRTLRERPNVVVAARTSVCGERFDGSELKFQRDRVRLTIWRQDERRWHGDVLHAHIQRLCFSRVDGPPYILVLHLDAAQSRSSFTAFYDPLFAKVWKEHETKVQAALRMYGVVFYFDEAIDYMRCQSIADGHSSLARLSSESLSDDERRMYLSLDASKTLRHRQNSKTNDNMSTDCQGQSFATLVGKSARQALGSMTSFFRPVARSSVLEEDDSVSVARDHDGYSRGRVLYLSRQNPEVYSPNLDEEKLPIPVNVHGTDKQDRGPDVDGSDALVPEKKQDEKEKCTAREALSCREIERLKRRRIESRRNEVLLEYPYDESDTLGKIKVTLGDVDRLVPGEFLNDNLIDFYLRFLWRHLDTLQQQQMYFFTSHFFSQLNGTNGAHELSQAGPDERFARVARWTQKETDLFDKRFLFIPINDSFHWSIAIICNPGSAIIKKHHKVKRCRRVIKESHTHGREGATVDLVNNCSGIGAGDEGPGVTDTDDSIVANEIEEKELDSCQVDRLAYPPCLLFLDSLRCHRKKKFTKMLRNYLECEYKARFASSSADVILQRPATFGANDDGEQETVVTVFDSDSIVLYEPTIPLQTNSSDCGVFLLMYALLVVRLFPFGVTREDLENNLTSTLTPEMFREEHVLEFREYLQQVLFCLQCLEKHGRPEQDIKEEELESFAIE